MNSLVRQHIEEKLEKAHRDASQHYMQAVNMGMPDDEIIRRLSLAHNIRTNDAAYIITCVQKEIDRFHATSWRVGFSGSKS